MTNQKSKSMLCKQHQREGITLLFVLSMVVLFLLMGTTFVVVSNDYFRSARRRSLVTSNVFDGEAFLDSAFYQLLRDVPLSDSSSPIRFHSILADQYGYGFKGTVDVAPAAGGQFVVVVVGASPDGSGTASRISRMRLPGETTLLRSSDTYFDGVLNGQVFTITSGPLEGTSRRIISHTLTLGTPTNGTDDMLEITLLRGNQDWSVVSFGDEFVLNGRDFSGVGFGDATTLDFNDFDVIDPAAFLGPAGPLTSPLPKDHPLVVNQKGVPFASAATFDGSGMNVASTSYCNGTTDAATAFTTGTGFISIDGSPNEAYDAPDFQNMFLSGFDSAGNVIPSFHRDSLYAHVAGEVGAGLDTDDIRGFNFRPFMVTDPANDNDIQNGSTANGDFIDGTSYLDPATGLLRNATANDPVGLDVDSDGDGILDSVWIDIGLPTQTNSSGDTFRPLVAYRVVDMDGKLNVNAHGSTIDQALGAGTRRGSGYGVAEISLLGVCNSAADYLTLLTDRSNAFTVGTDVRFDEGQKLFGYISGENDDVLGDLFATGSNVFGQHVVQSNIALPDEMPGFGATLATTLTTAQLQNPYTKNFSIAGGTGDDLYRPSELEPLIRRFDGDSNLITSRLADVILPADGDKITTNSFNITIPATAVSLPQRLNQILQDNGVALQADRSTAIATLIPRDILLGGKLDLNRPLGNGEDDDTDGVVDDETGAQTTAQRNSPTLDLDNAGDGATGDTLAKHLLAKDIYITMLLACGDRAPVGFVVTVPTETFPTVGAGGEDRPGDPGPPVEPPLPLTSNDREYRKLIAQYAINLVDFRDPDSIMTPFEFDIEPFDDTGWDVDGDVSTTGELDGVVVWGAERPDLLLTESFASHDRQTMDTGVGGSFDPDPATPDNDWDGINAPITSAMFEIYNPWLSSSLGLTAPDNGIYGQPNELGTGGGAGETIDLGKVVGGSPVWRIGLKRAQSEDNADIVRSIYFAMGTYGTDTTGDNFFPATAAIPIAPGGFMTVAPTVDPVIDTATVSSGTDVVRITGPRSLSISDPNGGYLDTDLMTPVNLGEPYSLASANASGHAAVHDPDDLLKINTNGIVDNFRHAYLQRLADPTSAFDVMSNPYLTVDTMAVDLLAGNSLGGSMGAMRGEKYENAAGDGVDVDESKNFELRSTQRGESFTAALFPNPVETARQNLFSGEVGELESDATETIPAVSSSSTFGAANTNYVGTTPNGSLTWNNRPFASAAEALNVPYLSGGLLTFFCNQGVQTTGTVDPEYETYRTEIVPFFSSNSLAVATPPIVHNHLLRFDGPLGVTGTTIDSNRFARFFDFVDVPSRFLGTETYLEPPYPAGFNPPFHFVPSFREPGKVNINTIGSSDVWDTVEGGFGTFAGAFALFQGLRDFSAGPTDVAGYFTSSEGRMFVPEVAGESQLLPAKGSAGTLTQLCPTAMVGFFDATNAPANDSAGSSYFHNELRQRISGLTTTRSSVFSIWITIGYFKIDEFGRIGAEIGSDGDSRVRRNRAFYMIDRSIPVAFEPGRNHNVDDAVLLRTIIE